MNELERRIKLLEERIKRLEALLANFMEYFEDECEDEDSLPEDLEEFNEYDNNFFKRGFRFFEGG